MDLPLKVLALCTGNRARSILAEAMLNARPEFAAHSAGSQPKGEPHPVALATLEANGIPTEGLRSKSWDEFAAEVADAPRFDVVLTLCDSAAGESCPLWHGAPVRAHWGLPDPVGMDGPEEAVFAQTFSKLRRRIDAFAALPLSEMSPEELRPALQEIGKSSPP